uniref:PCI domain-containing protein n=2 Tax=Chrysotila carterae TaxID=13221 RepID=A0A7S4EW34_CHRCT
MREVEVGVRACVIFSSLINHCVSTLKRSNADFTLSVRSFAVLLQVSSLRQLEDLLIECFYEGLLQGKLDQQAGQLDVHYCIGRDIHPSDIESMCETLGQWHHNSVQMLTLMSEKLESYKEQCDAQRLQALELEQKIEQGKAHAPDAVDFGNPSTEFDVMFDDDVDKIRKGGRTKGKHALGVGPRK